MKLRLFIPFVLLLGAISAFSQTENVKYTQMTDKEKLNFIENKSNEFLRLFRTVGNYQIDEQGTIFVKRYVDSYLKSNSTKNASPLKCYGDDLTTILKRGKLYAPDIKSSFTDKDLPAQVGLYIAMIESAFCPCIQSSLGPLGMFQFTADVGSMYGIKTVRNASPQKPDDRCKVKPAASGAATYLKKMADLDFGNNAIGIPFAISAYNSGEESMKKLKSIANPDNKDNFAFWEMRKFEFNLVADASNKNVIEQFNYENSKYFPKFLAGMIIGENPKVFGINMEPLSKY